jgi:thiol-disulfide isomerase/thioredoxin
MKTLIALLLLCSVAVGDDYGFLPVAEPDYGFLPEQEKRLQSIEDRLDRQAEQIDKLIELHKLLNKYVGEKPAEAKKGARYTRRTNRIVLVGSNDCPPCIALAPKVEKALDALEKQGDWTIGEEPYYMIQHFFADERPELLEQLGAELGIKPENISFPFVVKIEDGKIVRRWTPGCTTPMDVWTFSWLADGVEVRPVTVEPERATVARSGQYPLTGGWWSVEGQWNPSKSFLISHLTTHSNHAGRFARRRGWLETLSISELQSVHTDDHTGRLKWSYIDGQVKVVSPAPARVVYQSTCPNCPNYRSPNVQRSTSRRRGGFLQFLGN